MAKYDSFLTGFGSYADGFDASIANKDDFLRHLIADGNIMQMDGVLFDVSFDDKGLENQMIGVEYGNSEKAAKPWIHEFKRKYRNRLAWVLLSKKNSALERLLKGQDFKTVMGYAGEDIGDELKECFATMLGTAGIADLEKRLDSIQISPKFDEQSKKLKIRDDSMGGEQR